MTAIRTRVWRNGILEKEDFPFERVSDYLEEPDTLVWADLLNPDAHTIAQLAEELSLDQHAVEDALAMNERPKTTRYATHFFLTANSVRFDATSSDLVTGRVSSFATRHAFVTVRLDDEIDMDSVLARWDANSDLLKFGSRALVHGLLDELVDRYFVAIESIDDRLEQIEDILFDEDGNATREVSKQTYALRRALVRARRAIVPMRDVVNTIMHRFGIDDGAPELAPYYVDLYDHALRAAEWTDSLRDMISSIFETNMQLADSRMNTIMKKLTSWAAIIAVPTAVTGWFGQNVPYPGFGTTLGFWLSVVVIVIVAVALYLAFRRKDWL